MGTAGWSLSGRLIAKHVAGLGDQLATLLVTPDAAMAVDRETLQRQVQECAAKAHTAREAMKREAADVENLRKQIAADEAALPGVLSRLESGSINEAVANRFANELELARQRLPQEQAELDAAQAHLAEIESLLELFTQRLKEFDQRATAIRRDIDSAESNMALQSQRQADLAALASPQGSASGLSALAARAEALRAQAAGMQHVNDTLEAPMAADREVAALRKSLSAGPVVSTADRLRGLMGA